jgi:branched-chain amino acid transport system ATP-binding protein
MRESESGMLQVDNITKNFGGITAVADVSFAINKGEVVSLMAPTEPGRRRAST